MALHVSLNRQRVPMIDASTLEDRTRPANVGIDAIGARLRYYQWPTWSGSADRTPSRPVGLGKARLDRRQGLVRLGTTKGRS